MRALLLQYIQTRPRESRAISAPGEEIMSDPGETEKCFGPCDKPWQIRTGRVRERRGAPPFYVILSDRANKTVCLCVEIRHKFDLSDLSVYKYLVYINTYKYSYARKSYINAWSFLRWGIYNSLMFSVKYVGNRTYLASYLLDHSNYHYARLFRLINSHEKCVARNRHAWSTILLSDYY